jgi:hypothetical protein
MRSIIERWLAPASVAGLVLVGASMAQPPGQVEGPTTRLIGPRGISVDEMVERIMAFDKTKKGKVTKEELPERMHHLIALGDTNKDGALDKDEIRKLVTTPKAFGVGAEGFSERIDEGFGTRIEFGSRVDGGLVGPGPGPGAIEGVVDDLKLSGKKKDQAMATVKAHRENVRKLMEQARGELLLKMKGILSEEELKDFQAALDRPRGATFINVGPRETTKGDIERTVEQLQKELADLRRLLRR